ncbi:hypothetical protein N7456_009897 [Penicillium angulare]|uniref:Uncharacterized protein n=1 Tax=Penicillium angulare TaxID=116970 RepID=A0A9W9K663_9EURO|nr:hypothetical protein N7456_009897 [Penicillium angulare]
MASTPPPPSPSSLRVPGAPLHGAGYDTYEPYPTRSSARLASQRVSRSQETTPPLCPGSPSKGRSQGSPRKYRRLEDTTLSPPGSHSKSRANENRGRLTGSLNYGEPQPSRPSSTLPSSTGIFQSQTLPTPAKTPSKKRVAGDLSSTARTLFPPSTKMSSRTKTPFSLDSLDETPGPARGIEIFTDSRDRIPAPSQEALNPFHSQSGLDSDSDRPVTRASRRVRVGDEKELTYLFRGKEFTKKLEDLDQMEDDDPNDLGLFAGREHLLPDPSVLQRVKPLRRKDIKPRLLWTADGKPAPRREPKDENVSAKKHVRESTVEDEATDEEDGVDDEPHPHNPKSPVCTPQQLEFPRAPGATRNLRSQARMDAEVEDTPSMSAINLSHRKSTPFNSWLRKKKGPEELSPAATPAKRDAQEEPAKPPGSKRSRTTRSANIA